ncbi:MAG TPA: hypothetical protein VGC21_03600 [Telluria sp.]|jgi:hypothetical protein
MDIKLNYRNDSNDIAGSRIVIFQRNVAVDYEEIAVAWKVIQNCGSGEHHPFVFPILMQVDASDIDGNFSQRLDATNGNVFSLSEQPSGHQLARTDEIGSPRELHVRNDLEYGAITCNVYKGTRLLATKRNVSPGEKGVFRFNPTIWIGVVSDVVEGELMDSAVITSVNTEISLRGIESADIVMAGGNNERYRFSLENVQRSQ